MHLNYNHLYYFWMVCKQGSVAKAADALFLTPQTVTGQIKAFEERMNGKLLKRSGRSVEPTELGQLIFRYADKMFGLSYEMLDIVNYSQQDNVLFDVGVADALSKGLVCKILMHALSDNAGVHLRCFESTHELLLEQLSQHKLDMILSDCPVDSSQSPGLYSKKLGECKMSFYSSQPIASGDFPEVLNHKNFLIPARRTSMGRHVLHWFDRFGIKPNILGEFDDAALMKAFGHHHADAIFLAPNSYLSEVGNQYPLHLIAEMDDLTEEYYIIFAERMIQHPSVKNICDADFSGLFYT